MKMFKKFVLCTSIALLSIGVVGCSTSNAKEPTTQAGAEKEAETPTETPAEAPTGEGVAKVGDTVITEEQVAKEMSYIEQLLVMQFGENYKENEEAMQVYEGQKQQAIDYLINIELVKQEAAKQKIKIEDSAIEEKLTLMKANFPSDVEFEAALKEQNITLDAFKGQIEESLLVEQVIEKATEDVKIKDKDVEAYYNENIANYTVNPGANMAHILVPTEEEAKKIKAEYDGGKTFEELAKQYGTDGTKDQGGALGFIPYDSTQYDADFLAGVKALKEGEVSAPVKTQFGYHLIKADGITTEAVVTPFEEVSEEIKATVLDAKKGEAFNAYLEKLRDKGKVEIFEQK